jgi:hypothetical protein
MAACIAQNCAGAIFSQKPPILITGAFTHDFYRAQHSANFSRMRSFKSAKRLRLPIENMVAASF